MQKAGFVAFASLLLLVFSGCTGPATELGAPRGPPVMNYSQEFDSTTLRGSLTIRAEIEPQEKETCVLLVTATVVRSSGRFSLFTVTEKRDGSKTPSAWGESPGGVSATILGTKSSTVVNGPLTENIRFLARYNETRAQIMTLYFEDIDATKAPFKARIECPNDPVKVELFGGRQGMLIEPSRTSTTYIEAELCPDLVAGIGGTKGIHLDAAMRFWFTSEPAVGILELVGPAGTKTWDLALPYPAVQEQGPAGDYRVSLHRANLDQGTMFDHFAAAIGAFPPPLNTLDDLNRVAPPRFAATDSNEC